eukprot:TRINITY_DN5364_c0_g1_i1.p1 TRINITY_DN5364_c0_g1~~TRINITY_DN5364_c0_g1_i1.p1  ORF type:complete len:313 (-),score=67.19 TRINITY_DN5364_c0_g1_i1:9-947(-)
MNKRLIGAISYCGAIHEDIGDPNQDTFFAQPTMYGVIDGHGPSGEGVATFLKTNIPNLISAHSTPTDANEDIRNILSLHIQATMRRLDDDICGNASMEESGATISFAYFHPSSSSSSSSTTTTSTATSTPNASPHSVTVACVGDCSATIATYDDVTGTIRGTPLLSSHRIDNEMERNRIESSGGKISGYYVVHPHNEEKIIGTTRTLGDKDMKTPHLFGVVSTPEIRSWAITPNDKFMILASDGFLEVPQQDQIVSRAWTLLNQNYPKTDEDTQEILRLLMQDLEQTLSPDDMHDARFQDDTTVILIVFQQE